MLKWGWGCVERMVVNLQEYIICSFSVLQFHFLASCAYFDGLGGSLLLFQLNRGTLDVAAQALKYRIPSGTYFW